MRLSLVRRCKSISPVLSKLPENELFVKAPWGKIAVLTWGDPLKKPVLLCHGKIDSAAIFRPLVQLLPDSFYYIGVEFPGNGKSEHLPPGVPLSVLDFVPTVKNVVDHFGLNTFAYIGHSMGAHVGKFYHIAYPGRMKAAVDLDPAPAYMTHEMETLDQWYHYFYGSYFSEDKYKKYNAPKETAPIYTFEEAMEMMTENRGLSEEGARLALERTLEPVRDGKYRFTFDQRMKVVMRPPFSSRYLRELYTSSRVPILSVVAKESIERGWFSGAPFILDRGEWRGDYDVIEVDGGHDVHLDHPERIADVISKFLIDKYLIAGS